MHSVYSCHQSLWKLVSIHCCCLSRVVVICSDNSGCLCCGSFQHQKKIMCIYVSLTVVAVITDDWSSVCRARLAGERSRCQAMLYTWLLNLKALETFTERLCHKRTAKTVMPGALMLATQHFHSDIPEHRQWIQRRRSPLLKRGSKGLINWLYCARNW